METTENNNKINKAVETLTKELNGLNDEQLHEFFMFFYKINHQHYCMADIDSFERFLEAFDSNPFKVNNKIFKKELIENVVKYSFDHISLITAAVLIKRKFSINEIKKVILSASRQYLRSIVALWRLT